MKINKYLALFAAIMTLLVSAGCTPVPSSSDQNKQQTKQEEQQKTQDSTTGQPEQKTNKVCLDAGLGDTQTKWEIEYGHAFAQGDTIKVFKDGAYKVVFDGDTAVTVTFVSKKGNDPLVQNMLPRDGVKKSETSKDVGGMTMTTEKWHSDALAAAIPDTKGNYTIMKNKKGKTYTEVVADCSPHISK
ncbi:MAG: hypothetical protein LKF74_05035 [Megasphaera sp.]|jgi:hypothetical protein|nr:hypothetical protein [Megasphaera sp.]MCH4188193.1 hypothetical protein [Megasphaera sp.]MCH4217905.1 hypothetical protein [Megasphaera sp.]